ATSLKSRGPNSFPFLATNGTIRVVVDFAAVGGIVCDWNGGLEIVKAIQDSSSSGSNFALVRRIHQLLTKVKHWSPWHISREDNNDVNDLTKWSKIEGKDYGCLRTLFGGADLVVVGCECPAQLADKGNL
ncbi:hypothetical protein Goari_023080, partial [Gossypium aridum]|nr:hypothetical protein [Gossypium aridum]